MGDAVKPTASGYMHGWKGDNWQLGLLLGLLTCLGFAPYDCWWLVWLLLVVLVCLLVRSSSAIRAGSVLAAWWLGLFVSCTYWLSHSLQHYGDFSVWLSYILIISLAIFLSVPAWLAGWSIWQVGRCSGGWWFYVLWCPLIFVLMEFGVAEFEECAWLQLAYSQLDSPFGGLAGLFGAGGVSFLLVQHASLFSSLLNRWCNGVDADRLKCGLFWYLIYTISLLMLGWYGRQQSMVKLDVTAWRVRLVQLATTPDNKWDPEAQQAIIERYWQLSDLQTANNCLVIWPEAAVTEVVDLDETDWRQLDAELSSSDNTLLVGCLISRDGGIGNGLVAIGAGGGVYCKRRLLPFGEYFPIRNNLLGEWLARWVPFSDLQAGGNCDTPILVGETRIATAICSEIAYSRLLALQIPPAKLIVAVADDSWFGLGGVAGQQHLAIARMRSLEFGRYQIWANNSGPSAVIDHRGQVVTQTHTDEDQLLQADVYLGSGQTIYSRLYSWVLSVIEMLLSKMPHIAT